MEKSNISLVVIVKNEAVRLGAFLDHHRSLVAESIVLDTGSTDETIAIATAKGATVHSYQWNDDFSAARNAAIAFARFDWTLCIDADERIAKSDFPKIRAACGRTPCCYLMPQRNYYDNPQHNEWMPTQGQFLEEERGHIGYFVAINTKLFSSKYGIQFEGRVHESVIQSVKQKAIPIVDLDVPIHHYGYVISEQHNLSRNTRYGKLLELKIKEHPQDVQVMEEYATHLLQIGKPSEAMPLLKRLNNQTDTNSNITRARILYGTVMQAQGDIESAASVFRHAAKKDPKSLFPRLELLKILASQKQLTEMGNVLDSALADFGDHPLLLREQSRYLIETRQIHQAAIVTRKVAQLFPTLTEYDQVATRCEQLSKKIRTMEANAPK